MKKNYYNILDVAYPASQQEIKKAYRQLVLKYHPDRTFGNKKLERKFLEVHEAYDTFRPCIKKTL
jgi:molecular chaperone DnaJ